MSEEKEVGPEIPGSQDQLDTMLEGNRELDKELTSSELEGQCWLQLTILSENYFAYAHLEQILKFCKSLYNF